MRRAAGIAAMALVCGLAYGQNADQTLTFEVASVKPSPPPNGGMRAVRATGVPGSPYGKDPGRFTTENFSLPNLITLAYDIPYYRLSAPDLPFTVMFNIEAKMPVGTTKEQFQVMMQNLLAERFGLKVHWVSRQLEMYDLVVAKGGPKVKLATPDPPPETGDSASRRAVPGGPPARGPGGYPTPPPGNQRWMAIMGDRAAMRGHNESAVEMAAAFSNQVGGPVNDATGLTGKYDYTIYWSAAAASTLAAAAPPPDDGPTLFDALQEQLGLKLEKKKAPVQVLVVDHVETKPTEN